MEVHKGRRAWSFLFKALTVCLNTEFFQPARPRLAGKRRCYLADVLNTVVQNLPDTTEFGDTKKCRIEQEEDYINLLKNYKKMSNDNDFAGVDAQARYGALVELLSIMSRYARHFLVFPFSVVSSVVMFLSPICVSFASDVS
jgi:hypothetical protein